MVNGAVCGVAYSCAWLLALVLGFTVWSHWHLVLRGLGSDPLVFFSTMLTFGVLCFAVTASLLDRVSIAGNALRRHVTRAWVLYLGGATVLIPSIAYWPSAGTSVEGGNIAGVVASVLALLGVGIDLHAGSRRGDP